MTHTSGPWLCARLGEVTEAIVTDEGDSVCDVRGASPADLSLIANAPALLAALQNLVGMAEYFPSELYTQHPSVVEARAAIARATHTPEN